MLRIPSFKVIARHCIVPSCGPIIKDQHLQRFVSHSTMLIEKFLLSNKYKFLEKLRNMFGFWRSFPSF